MRTDATAPASAGAPSCPCNCPTRPMIDMMNGTDMRIGDLHSGQPVVTAEQAAELADITLRTFHNYHQTARAPKPDGWIGRTPLWLQSTIDGWLESRNK